LVGAVALGGTLTGVGTGPRAPVTGFWFSSEFSILLLLPQCLGRLSPKNHPTVESGRALLAAAAWLDSDFVRHTFDDIPEANFLITQKPWQPDAMRPFRLWSLFFCTILNHFTISIY
jgi:hypothetical protein